MEQERFQTLLRFLKVLADESRLKLLGLLAEDEYSVGDLAEHLDLKEAEKTFTLPYGQL